MSDFYEFVRIQFMLGRMSAQAVKDSVPMWITSDEVDEIINGQAHGPERETL